MRRWKIVLIIVFVLAALYGVFFYLTQKFAGLFVTLQEKSFLDIEQIEQPFCSQEVVDKILFKLEALKIYQKSVSNGHLKYIGTPSYIVSKKKHPALAKKSGVYLRDNFLPLYQAIQKHLELRIGKKCYYPGLDEKYEGKISLPGFHLFSSGKMLSSGWRVASMHIDLQYKRTPLPEDKVFDQNKTISFTLALSVPGGSGIYFFNAMKDTVKYRFPRYRTFNNVSCQKINYIPGYMYLHDGHHFHMISEFYSKDVDRVTLQGHGIYCVTDDTYWLYW